VLHVRREELGIEQQRGCADQVVRVLDPAVTGSITTRQRSSDPRDIGVDGKPNEHRGEVLRVGGLGLAQAGEKLESNELAGADSYAGSDRLSERLARGVRAAKMIDRDRRIEQLHSMQTV
jgi:hypothetical protein